MKTMIKQGYLLYKRRVADVLQQKTERFSTRRKKLLLFLFCACFAGMSIYAMVSAFTSVPKPVAVKGHMPRIVHEKQNPVLPYLSKKEYERIERFKQQIYALPKPVFDSFIQARPKLMDSIAQIEHYYQTQK